MAAWSPRKMAHCYIDLFNTSINIIQEPANYLHEQQKGALYNLLKTQYPQVDALTNQLRTLDHAHLKSMSIFLVQRPGYMSIQILHSPAPKYHKTTDQIVTLAKILGSSFKKAN
jgi:hypothetical protein